MKWDEIRGASSLSAKGSKHVVGRPSQLPPGDKGYWCNLAYTLSLGTPNSLALKDDTKACVIREVSRILEEEPCLEAVALSENQRKLSIATLGPDEDHRLAGHVSQAVAEGMADCGHLTQAGVCSVCGGKPAAQVGSSRVVVKEVLGSTLIEKQTCPTAISFWKWIAVKWPNTLHENTSPSLMRTMNGSGSRYLLPVASSWEVLESRRTA